MRILVIGGTLFIGKLLVDRLRQQGHDVTILHRSSHGGSDEVVADRNDPAAVTRALAGQRFDAVFDNVYDWERGTTAEQVLGTVQACGDVQRYVFMSSVAAYGDGLDHVESDPLAPDNHAEEYVRNKAQTERALFASGRPVVTFRPPFIYGPGNPFYREAFFWDRLLDARPILVPEDGQRLMQFVYVGDLVDACLSALANPVAGEPFNVGDSAPVTQLELVEALAEASGRKAEIAFVSREKALAAGGDPMGPKMYFAQYYDLPPITENTTKIRTQLGFQPTGFQQGLREAFAWYSRQPRRPVDYSFEDELLRG